MGEFKKVRADATDSFHEPLAYVLKSRIGVRSFFFSFSFQEPLAYVLESRIGVRS